eukprot:TRINITY_DN112496_c0_g1_i1.p1 TRINITY_DN112496_c0_g1~~TRINITY_DN112496_c0_g1_i1.p1  ORF type:complete len:315 (+),score=86.11 TRINITY_DN112496_c0_g1_i1:49-945(+)
MSGAVLLCVFSLLASISRPVTGIATERHGDEKGRLVVRRSRAKCDGELSVRERFDILYTDLEEIGLAIAIGEKKVQLLENTVTRLSELSGLTQKVVSECYDMMNTTECTRLAAIAQGTQGGDVGAEAASFDASTTEEAAGAAAAGESSDDAAVSTTADASEGGDAAADGNGALLLQTANVTTARGVRPDLKEPKIITPDATKQAYKLLYAEMADISEVLEEAKMFVNDGLDDPGVLNKFLDKLVELKGETEDVKTRAVHLVSCLQLAIADGGMATPSDAGGSLVEGGSKGALLMRRES